MKAWGSDSRAREDVFGVFGGVYGGVWESENLLRGRLVSVS